MAFKGSVFHWISWLRSGIRFGQAKRSWRSYRMPGDQDCDQAVLMIGGLSSNAATTNRTLAQQLHRGHVHTWSRNLFGHTGLFSDFSRSRWWNWIADGVIALRKLVQRNKKRDILLVGHSTGGLVVLALLILHALAPRKLIKGEDLVSLRGVLIFPPFRLRRSLDTKLLWIVAVLYYLVCPAAFLLIAFSGKWMWPMSLMGYLCHLYFVPKIYVPSGDQRAAQATKKRSRVVLSESVLLVLASIYFVAAPPLIALFAQFAPTRLAVLLLAAFIVTLILPLLIIPRSPVELAMPPDCQTGDCPIRHVGYRWLPVITVANLVIFQFAIKYFLKYCRDPLLIIEGGQDQVVVVDPRFVSRLQTAVTKVHLASHPHSDLSWQQQIDLAEVIFDWLENSAKRPANSAASG